MCARAFDNCMAGEDTEPPPPLTWRMRTLQQLVPVSVNTTAVKRRLSVWAKEDAPRSYKIMK